jgi:hypothetical protein
MKLIYMSMKGNKFLAGLVATNPVKLPLGLIEEFLEHGGQEMDYKFLTFTYHGWLFPNNKKALIKAIADSYLEGDLIERTLVFEKLEPSRSLPTIDGITLLDPENSQQINQKELPDCIQVIRVNQNTIKRVRRPGKSEWSGRLVITALVRDRPDNELFDDWYKPGILALPPG